MLGVCEGGGWEKCCMVVIEFCLNEEKCFRDAYAEESFGECVCLVVSEVYGVFSGYLAVWLRNEF